ncbi:5-hydroxytryptamine receptor 1 [Amyelois transitella]|uniref:5-hydroxytryptamine receptor 1 n=1 Tax=Amyelois transitella TaxID=680683 RepID=UPI00067D6241|nr:5-hydroxytryptamine receptor 1 [Amyelois transitella]XP_013185098.1 5-hydroxytryptamine receptor 1 [Amyelois transitella]XP_013185099.1 5-hydroxytryptamine receptor 1 [Amyelois transitella]XP_013185100.1 5-hydroxytryptamine receptor 1 [Amyelois transitella]
MATQSHNSHCLLPNFIALSSHLFILVSFVLLQTYTSEASVLNESSLTSEFNISNPNSTVNWTLLDDNLTDSNVHVKHRKYSTGVSILLATIFMIVIIGTVIGNILVCVAVCLVRKLRRPSNYLIVSLAVSDICVATIVMPIAMVYDIMGTWPFGPVICDFWVSSDVLSCAASILNLCMISVDRYYAITKPLEYGVKRTPKRMFFCVFIVWMSAAFISLPPVLILGNEKTETSCSVSQNKVYQIYATLGSFYIPLTVMIVVYYKIFSAARKIVKDEKRAQSHLETHCYLEINVKNGGAAEARLLGTQPAQPAARGSTASTNTTCSVEKTESTIGRCFSGQRKSNESQCPMLQHNKTPTKPIHTINRSTSHVSQSSQSDNKLQIKERRRQSSESSSHKITTNRIRSSLSNFAQKSHIAKDLLHSSHSPHQKKLRFQLAKERKASTTLGIIMSAFVICWLPFFVLALIRPFVEEGAIPDAVSALFLWLGYINSLLNPIIYATLNRDFRKPFQEILFFRCSNLNNMMREEFYHTQYGDPDPHYCVNHNTNVHNYDEGVEIVSAIERDDTRASESFL